MRKTIIIKTVCLAAMIAGAAAVWAQTYNHVTMIKTDFEDGTAQGWGPRGHKGEEESVAAFKGTAHSGEYSLRISNRMKTWQGPIIHLTDNAQPGDIFSVSAWLYYKDGPANAAFIFSIERSFKNPDAPHSYMNVGSIQAKKDVWTEVKLEYTVGPDPTQKGIYVYFERPYKNDDLVNADDKIDFYLDDIHIIKVDPASKPKIQEKIPNLYESYIGSFDIGAAVAVTEVLTTSQKSRLLMKHFTGIVAGNEMKMDAVQPKEGEFKWNDADRIVEFGELTGMRVRWHALQWHSQCPAWFFQDKANPAKTVSKDVLNARLKNHIQTIVKRYKGRVESYDVVNEVISDKTGKLRTGAEGSKWLDILGPDFIDNSFRWAREMDKNAQLVINDYNIESDKVKRQALYDLVKGMKARGVPVDAVGLQMHISVNYPSIKDIRETIDMFGELGVMVLVTELDVSVYESDKEAKKEITKALLDKQAARYKELFGVFGEAAEKGYLDFVVLWGTTDDTSWKNDFPVPGRTDAPLLFDAKMMAKPAFYSLVQ